LGKCVRRSSCQFATWVRVGSGRHVRRAHTEFSTKIAGIWQAASSQPRCPSSSRRETRDPRGHAQRHVRRSTPAHDCGRRRPRGRGRSARHPAFGHRGRRLDGPKRRPPGSRPSPQRWRGSSAVGHRGRGGTRQGWAADWRGVRPDRCGQIEPGTTIEFDTEYPGAPPIRDSACGSAIGFAFESDE
jgi:hypothetical protein